MTANRARPSLIGAAIAGAWLLLAPGLTLAHAELATATPADQSTVPAPTQIVLTFTENLDASASNIVLVDAGGRVVAQGGTVAADNDKEMTLALADLQPGRYTIRWTSKSADDGDIDRGTTTFTATAAASPSAGTSVEPAGSPSPSSASAAASPSVGASTARSVVSSAVPSDPPLPSGSDTSGGSTTSGTDALIPIVVGVLVIGGLAWWLLRSRSRSAS